MNIIYKLYGVIEPQPGQFYIPWFRHSETIRMHGDFEVREGDPWFEFAKWARENSSTGSLSLMFDEEQTGKIVEAFQVARPSDWDDLLARAGIE